MTDYLLKCPVYQSKMSEDIHYPRTLEQSVVAAMDGSDTELFPYIPYILQDLWEIGSSPQAIIELIQKHAHRDTSSLNVLDLGCGKGAVSVMIAKELGCRCTGIDALKEFINTARSKAKEYGVDDLCRFEQGDIREKVRTLSGYDIIILGSIGPVLGNYEETLLLLSKCLNKGGMVIIDDGYIEDSNSYAHPVAQKRSDILRQISSAGMRLVDENIIPRDFIRVSDEMIFDKIKQRCLELMQKHPDKKTIFENYLIKQEEENNALENDIVCSTMVVKSL